MIELSIEALIALIALCGGAGYLLGKDIHKAKSNCPQPEKLNSYFFVIF